MTQAATTIVVRPAGAERETLFVALLCVAILLAASAVVALRATSSQTTAVAPWQIDARGALTAAEQGINADLRVAADDIHASLVGGKIPTSEELAGEALPPFAVDATTKTRGGHVWSIVPARDEFVAWLGRSSSLQVAGSFLLRVATHKAADHDDAHAHAAHTSPTIWLNRSATAVVDRLSNEALIAAGWKEIVSRYDASVTREGMR